jgi:hypothetical protein
MPVSLALEKSAKDFCSKYTCSFDFASFETSVEEFTFLRPIGGWVDVYKNVFEAMYKEALEAAAKHGSATLDSEAMLDDFEYTLMRPYANEGESDIKHKPYVGMDRISRLEYLKTLTSKSPSNSVDLYAEKYRNHELSIKDMRSRLEGGVENSEYFVEMAACVQALENVNKSRSLIWRTLHPFKNSAEKNNCADMKRALIEKTGGGEEFYSRAADAAYETFGAHQSVNARLEERMLSAKEEMNRKLKMNDAMRESITVEGLEKNFTRELSLRVDQYKTPTREKQF